MSCRDKSQTIDFVILISANAEWKPVRTQFPKAVITETPFGECFTADFNVNQTAESVVFFHGGWGKIDAAASTQYTIDRWKPKCIINIGTCGGFQGRVNRNDVILVNKTVVYDIIEEMGDSDEAIADYTTDMDLSWIKKPYPSEVIESVLVSGDRDILRNDIPRLIEKYDAIAGDWESGAIAFIAQRNQIPCVILRAVSDMVGSEGGEVYGD
jgi:adenosylhomocysteine nucleosidase